MNLTSQNMDEYSTASKNKKKTVTEMCGETKNIRLYEPIQTFFTCQREEFHEL
jgi:hypothetical protein